MVVNMKMKNENFKERVDFLTKLIESCWDENQPLGNDGRPLDGLSFDERLTLKRKELRGQDKVVMNLIMEDI